MSRPHRDPEDLHVDRYERDGGVVVCPIGRLDLRSYPQLRDLLLTHLAEQPRALIVDLDGLHTDTPTALSVFATVWRQVRAWPAVPLMLSTSTEALTGMLHARAVPRFVPTFPSVADAVAALGDPPPRRRAELTLTLQPSTARAARQWVRTILHEWHHDDAHRDGADTDAGGTQSVDAGSGSVGADSLDAEFGDDVVLVASELVENATRHTRSPGTLRLEHHPHGLAVAVSDGDPTPPVHVTAAEATRAGGRGIAVIAALATVWGHHPRLRGGKIVWALLAPPHDRVLDPQPALR